MYSKTYILLLGEEHSIQDLPEQFIYVEFLWWAIAMVFQLFHYNIRLTLYRYYRQNDIADAYRKLMKKFRQHFIVILSQNRTAHFAQFYKIVLHTFNFLLHTLCSKTHYFRPHGS